MTRWQNQTIREILENPAMERISLRQCQTPQMARSNHLEDSELVYSTKDVGRLEPGPENTGMFRTNSSVSLWTIVGFERHCVFLQGVDLQTMVVGAV